MTRIREDRARPGRSANRPSGFSLIELLIVITVLGIVTGAALSHLQTTVNDQLDAAAHVVASDLAYVRNLAVANNSSYRVTFAPGSSRYYFEHSGQATALDTLPSSPHGSPQSSPTRQTTDMAVASLAAGAIRVAAVHLLTPDPAETTTLEFGPLGETTRSEVTVIWLGAGRGEASRFLPLTVNPVTGNVEIGQQVLSVPPVVALGGGPFDTTYPGSAPP